MFHPFDFVTEGRIILGRFILVLWGEIYATEEVSVSDIITSSADILFIVTFLQY